MINKRVLVLLFIITGLFIDASYGRDNQEVYFDQGHGQMFLADRENDLDLSGLAKLFINDGFLVRAGNKAFSEEFLSTIDVLIISGPFKSLSPEEVNSVIKFIQGGGKLAVMLHIGPPALELFKALKVDFSNGVIREREGIIEKEPLNFRVSRLKPHKLTKGLKRFNLYGGWAVINSDDSSKVIAETGPKAWVDLDQDKKLSQGDAVQSFGVAVAGNMGNGRFVVFGDDAIFQNRFLVGDNLLIGKRLVEWFKQQ